MIALDADQRILGADRNARSILFLDSALVVAGLSLWTFFERTPAAFGVQDNGASIGLIRIGEERPWRAMVTPPRQPRIRHIHPASPGASNENSLSPRERSILELIGHGLSNKAIARELGISPETVKSHIKNMFTKLGVERRAQAIYQAKNG
jgi:DNA-binding CsgD family transcriptional regulator